MQTLFTQPIQWLFICCVLLLSTQIQNTQAQSLEKGRTALINYNIYDGTLDNELDKYQPVTSREKTLYNEAKQYFTGKLKDSIYVYLSQAFKEKEINILAPEKVATFIYLGSDGYPFTPFPKKKIKKITKENIAENFISCAINITSTDVSKILGPPTLIPEIKIVIKIFDPQKGEVLHKINAKLVSDKKIQKTDFRSGSFDKMSKIDYGELADKLLPLAQKVSLKVVDQINQ